MASGRSRWEAPGGPSACPQDLGLGTGRAETPPLRHNQAGSVVDRTIRTTKRDRKGRHSGPSKNDSSGTRLRSPSSQALELNRSPQQRAGSRQARLPASASVGGFPRGAALQPPRGGRILFGPTVRCTLSRGPRCRHFPPCAFCAYATSMIGLRWEAGTRTRPRRRRRSSR